MKILYGDFDPAWLLDCLVVSADVESTGLHWYKDKAFGVAIAGFDGKDVIRSMYVDLRERPQYVKALNRYLPQAKRVVNHNMKFDAHFLREAGIGAPLDRIECTSVRAALINEHEGVHGHGGFDLDSLGKKYVNMGKATQVYEELAKLFGGEPTKKAQMKNLHRAPERVAAKYAAPDPVIALMLWMWQEDEIKRQGLEKVWDLERRLMPVLIDMEQFGVRVDEERATRSIVDVDGRVTAAQRQLDELAGKPINANSAPQMRVLFGTTKTMVDGRPEWRTSSGFLLENTDGGEASVAKDSLIVMAEQGDKRAAHVLTLRRMIKGKSFLKDHILGHAVRGRVYPNYNQTRGDNNLGTGTGRFSVDDPALQQIPMHDRDVAEIVRPCFIPEPKQSWACADWEQFEFRWFAHYVKDPGIQAMYEKNPAADFHQTVAEITGISRDRKFAGDTANAKQINLGLVFGMGEGEMAYNMGMDYTVRRDRGGREWKTAGDKARAVFNKYHSAIPGVRKLLDQASSIARARGYVKTVMGRHIRFPDGKATYKAGGLTFQGSSADSMKVKMVELHPIAKKEGAHMLLSVHDELDFSLPDGRSSRLAAVIKKRLETFDGVECPILCRIPILSSVAVGENWWMACR